MDGAVGVGAVMDGAGGVGAVMSGVVAAAGGGVAVVVSGVVCWASAAVPTISDAAIRKVAFTDNLLAKASGGKTGTGFPKSDATTKA
jgi:2C-methyl-D-erythritol 2,4-cyclodiphosphate synthase